MFCLVLDTCIIISALRSRSGASGALLGMVGQELIKPIVTIALFLEYEAVLKRPEQRLANGMSLETTDRFLAALAASCTGVESHFRWRPQLADPNDEMVLEAALNGFASAIVTHNVKDFRGVTAQFGIDIISPQEAIRRIKQ